MLWNLNNVYYSPLHLAVYCGSIKCVEFLLLKKFDPNFESNNGDMPIHLCYNHDSYEIARLLIQYGADVNAQGFISSSFNVFSNHIS